MSKARTISPTLRWRPSASLVVVVRRRHGVALRGGRVFRGRLFVQRRARRLSPPLGLRLGDAGRPVVIEEEILEVAPVTLVIRNHDLGSGGLRTVRVAADPRQARRATSRTASGRRSRWSCRRYRRSRASMATASPSSSSRRCRPTSAPIPSPTTSAVRAVRPHRVPERPCRSRRRRRSSRSPSPTRRRSREFYLVQDPKLLACRTSFARSTASARFHREQDREAVTSRALDRSMASSQRGTKSK